MSATLGAAALSGLVAIGATLAIERFGPVAGGVLATLPTTIVPAAWGLAVASPDTPSFQAAMWAVPAGMFVNALFLASWRALPPRLPAWDLRARLVAMSALSLGAWAVCAAAMVALLQVAEGALPSLRAAGWVAQAALVGLGVLGTLRSAGGGRASRRVSPLAVASRGLLAAAAIGVAVALGAAGGALIAGMVSVFPAIFLTTMVSLWLAQGEAVPVGAVGPMMLGSSAVGAYALFAAELFPATGPALGTPLAWGLAAGLATAPSYLWLRRVRARVDRPTPGR